MTSKPTSGATKPRVDAPTTNPDASRAKPLASKPDALKPKPHASKSKPDASKSKPDASKSKPDTRKSKSGASKSKPDTRKSKSGASKQKPVASKPQAGPLKPIQVDSKTKPDATKSKPDPSKPKPDASTSKPDVFKSKPDAFEPEPDATKSKPDPSKPKPDASKSKPDASKPKPDAFKPKSDASKSKTDPPKLKLDDSKPKPDASKPKPDASRPMPEASKPKPDDFKLEPYASKPMPEAPKSGALKSKAVVSGNEKPEASESKESLAIKPMPVEKLHKRPDATKTVYKREEGAPEQTPSGATVQANDAPPARSSLVKKLLPAVKPPAVALSSERAPVDQPQEKIRPKSELSSKDILVIVTLWSIEIVYTIAEGLQPTFINKQKPSKDGPPEEIFVKEGLNVRKGLQEGFIASIDIARIVLLVVTLLATAAIAFLADGKGKLVFLFGGLCVYLITPLIGLVANFVYAFGLVHVLIVLQFGWTSVIALRYWFIFHQTFPLSVIQSRILVTCNVILVDVTNYITMVWLSLDNFVGFAVAWSVVLVLMIVWLGAIFFIKSFVNQAEGNAAEKTYSDLGLSDSFNARQTSQHLVLFLCLTFPSMMMSVQKSAISHIIREIFDDLGVFTHYRIDLVVSIVCLPIVAVILIFLPVIRQEIRDLLVIGLAHILNAVFCILFLILIVSNEMVVEKNEEYQPLQVIKGSIMTVFIYTSPEYAELEVENKNEMLYHHSITYDQLSYFDAPSGSTIWVIGKFKNGTTVFETMMKVTRNEAYHVNDKKLTKIKNFFKLFRAMPEFRPVLSLLLLVSGLKPCRDGPEQDDSGTRLMLKDGCHSVGLTLLFVDASGEPITEQYRLYAPILGKVVNQTVNLTSPKEVYCVLEYYLDGQLQPLIDASLPDQEKGNRPFTIFSIESSGEKDRSMKSYANTLRRYEFVDYPWTYRHSTSISLCISASSFAICVASASYLHFLWIQCPSNHRVRILAAFFGVNFLGAWLSAYFLADLRKGDFIALTIFQVIGSVWHACLTIIFFRKLRKLSDDEKKEIKNMLF